MELRQIIREFDKRIEEVKLSPNAILFLYRSYHDKNTDKDILLLSDLDRNKFVCLNLFDMKNNKIKKAGEEFIEDFLQGKPIKERNSGEQEVKLELYQPAVPVVVALSELIDDDVESARVITILKNESLISFFDTWICLFPPTSDPGKTKWEDLFGVKYENVSLRRRDESYIKKFKAISQKQGIDMGVFIIATYIFIRSHIHDGKAWIPKPARLLDDWEPWYKDAEQRVIGKDTNEILAIFNRDTPLESSNTGFHMM